MSERKQIKLIASDVDGTLLNSNAQLSKRTEAVLRKAIEQGIQVVLATGKTRNATIKHIEELGITAPGIYLQGLVIYEGDGKVRWQKTLDPAVARQVITFAEDRGYDVVAYSGMQILVKNRHSNGAEILMKYHEPAPTIVGSLQNVVNDMPIHKLIVFGEPRAIKALRWQLNLQLDGTARMMQAGIPEMLEILPPNSSKGAALKTLLKELHIAPENVMALGDAENDLEMFQNAGISVAMGQAAQNVKDAASYVTGTNDEDGAADAIEKFALAPEPAPAPVETAKPEPQAAEPAVTEAPVTSAATDVTPAPSTSADNAATTPQASETTEPKP